MFNNDSPTILQDSPTSDRKGGVVLGVSNVPCKASRNSKVCIQYSFICIVSKLFGSLLEFRCGRVTQDYFFLFKKKIFFCS